MSRIAIMGLTLAAATLLAGAAPATAATTPPPAPVTPPAQAWPANPVVVPGQAEASVLVKALLGQGVRRMPLIGSALTADQIATVKAWINGGAGEPTYTKTVQPIFTARCLPCHGAFAHAWHLQLDSFGSMLQTITQNHAAAPRDVVRASNFDLLFHEDEAGGPAAPATTPAPAATPWTANAIVIPGKGKDSALVKALLGQAGPRMPLRGAPLPADKIQAVQAWIDRGALEAEYTQTVLPIFKASCTGCHGASSHAAGLVFDSFSAFQSSVAHPVGGPIMMMMR